MALSQLSKTDEIDVVLSDMQQRRFQWHRHLHHLDIHLLKFLRCSLAQHRGLTVCWYNRETRMTTLSLRWLSIICLMTFLDHSMERFVDVMSVSSSEVKWSMLVLPLMVCQSCEIQADCCCVVHEWTTLPWRYTSETAEGLTAKHFDSCIMI